MLPRLLGSSPDSTGTLGTNSSLASACSDRKSPQAHPVGADFSGASEELGWPAGDVPGRMRLRDVEVSAEGPADEVALGCVFFVGALLKGVAQLWIESDGDDLRGASAESWPTAKGGRVVSTLGLGGKLVDQLVGDRDAAACRPSFTAHGRRSL